MRRIKEVDGRNHTVIMVQVQNEVGVLRDSRDRSEAANRAFAGQVPEELMGYLQKHKDTLAPELREVWAANGSKTAGTWEAVFGAGKPDSVAMPIQTTSPPMSAEEHESAWRKLHWPVDEIFMAWQSTRSLSTGLWRRARRSTTYPCSSMHGCSSPTWRGPEPIRAADRCRR